MKIHFIGCEGVSMKVLASIAEAEGHDVTGSDKILLGHDANNVVGKDLVVYSGAIGKDNEELLCAQKIGVPVMERADFLALTARQYNTVIAVAGCHGKTTTTAMLSEVMRINNPTVHIGGEYDFPFIGGKEFFITEACEYRRSFLSLRPNFAVITNIDYDHPDTYADIGEVAEAFSAFGKQSGTVIYNGDDPICRAVYGKGISYGMGGDNDFVCRPYDKRSFDVFYHDHYMGAYTLHDGGDFNIMNATAAISVAQATSMCYVDIAEGIKRFKGVKRRGEIIYKTDECTVISDYSHHPFEIEARLKSLKSEYSSVAVIFQPHTYSRTRAMPTRFMKAFDEADYVAFTNTFAARENGGDDKYIYDVVRSRRECEFIEKEQTASLVSALMVKYSCVVLMGAGDFQAAVEKKLLK